MRVLPLAAALAMLAGAAAAQNQATAQGDAGQGKATFMADGCFECHGQVGQGGRLTGPRLAKTQLPLDAFTQQLRQPSNEMPPYAPAVVPDADIANIYAYLQSLPAPQAGKDIPLLNQ
jgi:mono/diheme cytochrome c family protein